MTRMPVERRRGGAVPTWVLAVLAVVLVAGFMAWLAMTAEPSNSGGADDEGAVVDTVAERAEGVPAIGLNDFAMDPRRYEGGGDIRLANVPVDSRLGSQSFWLKLPNQGLYLVRSTPVYGGSPQPGQYVTAAGPILPMTDSVVSAWIAEGTITAEQEMEARYATSYMDAFYVAPGQAPAAATPSAEAGMEQGAAGAAQGE